MKAKSKSERPEFDVGAATKEASEATQELKDDDRIVDHLFFAPGHLVGNDNLDEQYELVLAADAAHLKTKEGGNLFTLTVKDANGQLALLAFMLSCRNESLPSWRIFFENVLDAYGDRINQPDVVIVTDGDKGGREALKSVLPNVCQFMCSRHLGANIAKVSGADASLYHQMVRAPSVEEAKQLIGRMSEQGRKKLDKFDLKEVCMAANKKVHGNHTSNNAESVNQKYKQGRARNMISKICCEQSLLIAIC
jgi:MULE transposase domain